MTSSPTSGSHPFAHSTSRSDAQVGFRVQGSGSRVTCFQIGRTNVSHSAHCLLVGRGTGTRNDGIGTTEAAHFGAVVLRTHTVVRYKEDGSMVWLVVTDFLERQSEATRGNFIISFYSPSERFEMEALVHIHTSISSSYIHTCIQMYVCIRAYAHTHPDRHSYNIHARKCAEMIPYIYPKTSENFSQNLIFNFRNFHHPLENDRHLHARILHSYEYHSPQHSYITNNVFRFSFLVISHYCFRVLREIRDPIRSLIRPIRVLSLFFRKILDF